MPSLYFSGRGKLLVASRLADGSPGAFRHVGNVPELNVNPTVETIEHKEDQTLQRLTDARMINATDVNVDFPLERFDIENLAMSLYGSKGAATADAVTAEPFPDGLVAGDLVRLKFPGASNVAIEDAVPAALVEGTNYEIFSAKHGTVKLLDVTGFTQPFSADYSYSAHDYVTLFSAAAEERWIRFEGLNNAKSGKPVLIELYRVFLNPTSGLPVIGTEFARLPLAGQAMYDDTKEGDAVLGQFGRIVQIDA